MSAVLHSTLGVGRWAFGVCFLHIHYSTTPLLRLLHEIGMRELNEYVLERRSMLS